MPEDVRVTPAHPTTLPHGDTARRLGWVHLPPTVRRQVERKIGATVVDSFSCDAGFTPGLASVLLCADGTRPLSLAPPRPPPRPGRGAPPPRRPPPLHQGGVAEGPAVRRDVLPRGGPE